MPIPLTLTHPLSTDMALLPRLLDHNLAPGQRNLLPDHPRQEHQLHAPRGRDPKPVRACGRAGGVEDAGCGGRYEGEFGGGGEEGAEQRGVE